MKISINYIFTVNLVIYVIMVLMGLKWYVKVEGLR